MQNLGGKVSPALPAIQEYIIHVSHTSFLRNYRHNGKLRIMMRSNCLNCGLWRQDHKVKKRAEHMRGAPQMSLLNNARLRNHQIVNVLECLLS